jgi:predicted GIY-YIG superfamily endonuclease
MKYFLMLFQCKRVTYYIGQAMAIWQEVTPNGFKNRHSFLNDNKTSTLVQLTPRQVSEDQMKLKRENELQKKIVRPRVQK